MQPSTIAHKLWGDKAKLSYLLIAAAILLFTLLGARDLWTQEHRWADIVFGMFYRHDYLHPYLGENMYYDKPLLSYWLIVALAKVTGVLSTWILRLPSALAGLLAVWSIYRLGATLKDRQLGLLSGWLLLTTFYFLFWARTSSADMLNMAGSLFAVAWYFTHRDRPSFINYTVFFMIVVLTSLCKGLGGVVVPIIAVLTDVVMRKSWREHLQLSLLFALIPALLIYILPFWASSHFGEAAYSQNGLYLVYKENILRYIHPFDHQGPIYTYFLYLPIYMLPWAVFFIPALVSLKSRWRALSNESKWIGWTLLFLFLFFTLSGSRRSYYVLPVVPIAILLTADWILSGGTRSAMKQAWSAVVVAITFIFLFFAVDVVPAWYYSQVGVSQFANLLKQAASEVKPWEQWNVVMLDAESKLDFYLQLPPNTQHFGTIGSRSSLTKENLLRFWPIISNKSPNTIFVSRKQHAQLLKAHFPSHRVVELQSKPSLPFMTSREENAPIAFIPVIKR